ncbi:MULTISPECIES: amino acid ABC transporter permease [unclassified Paenibacillus]|uniref:Amino acid ABC transporter permease n=1 Tax=Paenibacillus provencensis TaxID=441151 RepID=A0ABW3PYA6_9BACL|nr:MULTISPECIES: amino acid ABC transporter permease [unclassified Paenibacillus]MCM3129217.1 amino acid ABC transporter permease [Paenibacillus sp. MER 78]SFS69995.1 amino acid ABC transporter membrane protein 1, PAAT family [Paenibacillus sp. 453mf]
MPEIDISVLWRYWDDFSAGFLNTLKISLMALIGSFLIGAVIAVFRIAPIKPLNWFGAAYVEFIRNIPLLVTIFFFYYGLSSVGLNLDGFVSGTLGLTIYTSAFVAESIRAGIQSVPKGQLEAARSSGLSYIQTMVHVVMPQAVRIVLPAMGNQSINLVKNSSILAVVAGLDLMYFADSVNSATFQTLSVYTVVAILYLVITLPLNFLVHYLEKRLNQREIRNTTKKSRSPKLSRGVDRPLN